MLQRRTLSFLGLILALGGQYLLVSQTQMGILLLGGCLLITLLERWIYLVPLSRNWLAPLLLGVLGLSYWNEPRGWFFIAWALIIAGTGLRADRFIQGYLVKLKAEEERRERLAEMGFSGHAEEQTDDEADEPEETPTPEMPLFAPFAPLTTGRVLMALLMASLAALVGALVSYLVFRLLSIQADIFAILTGWLVGRAILQGTGGRSHRLLQVLSALLSLLSVLAGRLLMAPLAPDLWLIIFAIVGAWTGYQSSRGYQGP